METYIIVKGKPNEHLPNYGWIHPCLICNEPTSRIFKYFYNKKIYNCVFCKDCLKNSKYINTYMNEILSFIYR